MERRGYTPQQHNSSVPPRTAFCTPASFLLQLLRAVTSERDTKRKRDVIKKVIAYMTLGIDVSRLFSDMVLVRARAYIHAHEAARACLQAYACSTAQLHAVRACARTRVHSHVQACNTKDLVIKKMVYLYLCAYAQTNPELTLLAINTLQKDWYVRRGRWNAFSCTCCPHVVHAVPAQCGTLSGHDFTALLLVANLVCVFVCACGVSLQPR